MEKGKGNVGLKSAIYNQEQVIMAQVIMVYHYKGSAYNNA